MLRSTLTFLFAILIQTLLLAQQPNFTGDHNIASSTQSLKNIRKESYQCFVYKISAAEAEKFIKQDSIPIAQFVNQVPVQVYKKELVDTDELQTGHYVLIKVDDNEVVASVFANTHLIVLPANNQHDLQFYVRDDEGNFLSNAHVWVNEKEAPYNAKAQSYWPRQIHVKKAFIKVYAPTDTTFVLLEPTNDYRSPLWKQRWINFKSTKIGRGVTYLPNKAISFIKHHRYYRSSSAKGYGYILLNQPKYKLTDTVKLKAYILDKKWKRYKSKVDVWLEYSSRGKYNQQLLTSLSPVSPGSYVYSFPLSDTLPSDTRFTINIKTKNKASLLRKALNTEDYLLDEIGSYATRTSSDNYYPGDTVHIYTSAKDANGLSLLDGRATLVLTTKDINGFYKDSLYVPDTLFVEEKPLATEGETLFTVPASNLPLAKLEIEANMIFKNSNNEQHTASKKISYLPGEKELFVIQNDDSLTATLRVNGKPVASSCIINFYGDNLDKSTEMMLPATFKIDPLADEYDFTLYHEKDTLKKMFNINSYYVPTLTRISRNDTLGFIINNPYKIPISFIVFEGEKVIAAGKGDGEQVMWQKEMNSKRKMYTVKWNYTWASKEREGRENIALLYKLLNIKIGNTSSVFPGQKETISIQVNDYKNRPVEDVNLAAVAYNNQFKKDIDVREPPYLVKYKYKRGIVRDKYDTDDPYMIKRYGLGANRDWVRLFHLDTIPYYKILFPTQYPYDVTTRIYQFIPEVSVHVVKKGVPQQIHLLYLNRQLVYYNGTTDKMNYAFPSMQGYSQLQVRLLNKTIQVDSIYLQPFYKHDLIIDLDSLPAHSKVNDEPNYWTGQERQLLENSIWQFGNNYRTNAGYVWQNERVVKLNASGSHLVGPFNRVDSLHFFAPYDFDIHFKFEPGYEYNLSKQVERLEKKNIFPQKTEKVLLPIAKTTRLILGDTIVAPPVITYPKVAYPNRFIRLTSYFDYNPYTTKPSTGKLQFIVAKDTVLKYVILYSKDTALTNLVLSGSVRNIKNITPGTYSLLLVDEDFKTAVIKELVIKRSQELCLNTSNALYEDKNDVVEDLVISSMTPRVLENFSHKEEEKPVIKLPSYIAGNSTIQGKVLDAKGGNGIPGAAVMIKGTSSGVSTNTEGSFSIKNIAEGNYILIVSAIGYAQKEVKVIVSFRETTSIDIALTMASQNLEEVVVVGYGTTKRSMTASVVSIQSKDLTSVNVTGALQGRLAGVAIPETPDRDKTITIRGLASIGGENNPIYVIDGIIYNDMPANITPAMIQNIEVLKDAAATSVYGARGANGVVVITTGTKTTRNKFSDYAFWQPELFTDKEGRASFDVVYPDNVTGWELYVLGMDKKRRMGKGVSFTKSYKPIMAQLSGPQFLIAEDTVQVVGKAMNYTTDDYPVKTKLLVDNKTIYIADNVLRSNASSIATVPITTNTTDTITASYQVQTNTGFQDMEERKIPVFKKGTEEDNGSFYSLISDTTLTFSPTAKGSDIKVYVTNNTMDILLDELDHLKDYPYYCMEQIASKIKGLLLEKQARAIMKQPFKNEKALNQLLKKLLDAQLFDGGWSWWEKGKSNLYITSYIIEALLPLRQDPLVEPAIRNALLSLQNNLARLAKPELLQTLYTMSEAGHAIDYKTYLSKINFDSLTQHQQWQWVKISQQQHLEYEKVLQKLLNAKTETMTGGLHWGTENYRWYSNTTATTLLAYQVIEQEKNLAYMLPKIVQYFLEQRRLGYWRNTVESASITSTILPYLSKANNNFNQPTTIRLAADTTMNVVRFPYKTSLKSTSTKAIQIDKSGGGLTFVSLSQSWWNDRPKAVTDKFDITTYFQKNGENILNLHAGEKVKMIAKVDVKKDAEYVMIEIPIPAGCTYASKKQVDWNTHREFYKNKVEMFCEYLPKGVHEFEIELEVRYAGVFTLNPAKASLMYFPTLYGRNEMKKTSIK